ncbi:GNAT family N-acetyltransferase [Chitinimonas sp. BJB300]|uniref:GNAT family N-acetyltransferase n=1 Tax=Chitinimonas sp. BJB300 TaxID=1559339 RepID=UPI000C11DEB1|nr:GNAT family N-acetyltransferase [Chitinimonas sp. BJB300]PHV13460.1 GNAT family N-acetyltransferase [Chitinimonas sp. BJB300]TSJ89855.1 GNAT family N-acetyltransferase [Chitinimonas sp. BJB300]
MSAANTVLTTQRLTLEPLTAAHASELLDGLSNEALYRFIPQNPPASLDALQTRYKRLESRSSPDGDEWWLNWAVRLTDGEYIGVIDATVDEDNIATMGWFIFTQHQRKGYAKEAINKLREHLEGPFMAESFKIFIDTRNAASVALMESLGFKREAIVPNADNFKGSKSDEYRFTYVPAGVAKAAAKTKGGKR